jgi:ribosomal protein S18 acetylase RimI-like enzyme
MHINLRPALIQDFDYCESLYFSGMEKIIQELKLDPVRQALTFCQQWEWTQVRIITLDGTDIGWLQSTELDDALFLAQLFVETSFQGRGVGTQVMNGLIGEATRAYRAVTLGVVKSNPALRLYERLGFHITHQDDLKFYMRRDR